MCGVVVVVGGILSVGEVQALAQVLFPSLLAYSQGLRNEARSPRKD